MLEHAHDRDVDDHLHRLDVHARAVERLLGLGLLVPELGDRHVAAPLRNRRLLGGLLVVVRGDHGLRVAAVERDARLQLRRRPRLLLVEEHVDVDLFVRLVGHFIFD